MKPLFVLAIVFALSLAVAKLATGAWQPVTAGNTAMCVMLCFTAFGHFKFTGGMEKMIPHFVPFRKGLVYLTGVAEILLGLALLFQRVRYPAAVVLVILFTVMLPANINAAIHHIDFQTGSDNGKGPAYLWFRIPLQLFFIGWLLYFAIYP